jgi:predicted metal-dependent HD superfamily phosphohydrolase
MFGEIFKRELRNFTTDEQLVDKFWKGIESNYNKAGRYYHNLLHLDSLVDQLLPVKDQIEDWQTIILSIAYHDIIYNTLKQDNEEKSASFASGRLSELGLPAIQIEKCKRQILSTKGHQLSDDFDTNYFTDADLSVLGFDNNAYVKYAGQIRKEYRYYPDILYKPGRRKVLLHFLEMKNIFKTEYFQGKYEKQARVNISNELLSLS